MSAQKVSPPRTYDKPAEKPSIDRLREITESERSTQRIRDSLYAALLRYEARRLRRGK